MMRELKRCLLEIFAFGVILSLFDESAPRACTMPLATEVGIEPTSALASQARAPAPPARPSRETATPATIPQDREHRPAESGAERDRADPGAKPRA